MSKIIPVTPSFVAWQQAANQLLALETEMARCKRTVMAPEGPQRADLGASLAEVRLVAAGLFRVAFDEANLARGSRQAPYALA